MRIIIPMAGLGKRMRPHTLTVPKPLIPVAGKPIVQRLVEDIVTVCNQKVDEIAFVTGRFGKEAENLLLSVAAALGAEGKIFYQDEPLGIAHAIYCASSCLHDQVIVAFADTLFKATFNLDPQQEGIIWVQKVEDPSPFGVVKLDTNGIITDFVEKPTHFVSNLAIIGIYYFKDGDRLKKEIKYVLDHDIKEKGEYQLTTVLENMKKNGTSFTTGEVEEWLDCGNKNVTVYTNQRVLEFKKGKEKLVHDSVQIENSLIIEPCFIGENVILNQSVVGPHVSIGAGSTITRSIITNSIIQSQARITDTRIDNSMIGNYTELKGKALEYSLSDYSAEV
jgi:glucose-1-phosphate thymidylyltransferase